MEEEKVIGLLGQGGLGAVLIAAVWTIGNRFVLAMDKLVDKIDAHHVKDTAHHADVAEGLASLRARVDSIVERSDRERLNTPPFGSPRPAPGGQ